MGNLKYTVIKTEKQYYKYCNLMEEYMFSSDKSKQEDIELLDVLIEKWDNDHQFHEDVDPIELLKYLMEENGLKQQDLVKLLGIGKSTISKILNRQSRLSRDGIRILAEHFKLSQEAFNRPYKLEATHPEKAAQDARKAKRKKNPKIHKANQ